MKKPAVILIVFSCLLAGCGSLNNATVGDLERWWHGSVGESQNGLTVGDAERSWSRHNGMAGYADALSVEAANRHFGAMTKDAQAATSISSLNHAITENREYQRLLDSFSPAAANRAIDKAAGR